MCQGFIESVLQETQSQACSKQPPTANQKGISSREVSLNSHFVWYLFITLKIMPACANLRCWLLSQWKNPKWHPVRPLCLETLRYESVWSLHLLLKHQQKKIFILFYLNSVTKPQGCVSRVPIPKVLTCWSQFWNTKLSD